MHTRIGLATTESQRLCGGKENIYDPAGRVLSVANYWQEYNGSTGTGANQVPTYSTSKIADGKVAYDNSSTTGLRSNQKYYDVVSGAWSLDHTEAYTYDPDLDYLTEVDYNDGLSNEYRTWSYDAAGNRSSDSANSGTWTYDNLNRMTASPKLDGVGSLSSWTYSNDILGNRTNRNYSTNDASSSYSSWDVLNRMLVLARPSSGASYSYRADGQRIEKVDGPTLQWTQWTRTSGSYDMNYASNRPTSRYFYDGQMGFEDDYNPSGSVTKVNRYALGARGIDRIERYADSATTYGYPIYDGHGNIRTTLAKNGSSYTTGTFKTYDVWGSVRSGGGSTDPKQKYCGSLGHVADDESGLTYMRARYYEPSTGRFVSEDPGHQGWNWYAYCANEPLTRVDASGKFWWFWCGMFLIGALSGMASYAVFQKASGGDITAGGLAASALVGGVVTLMGAAGGFLAAATWTAAAAGDLMLSTIAAGAGITMVSALAGALQKAIDGPPNPLIRAVSCIMGGQFLIALCLAELGDPCGQ